MSSFPDHRDHSVNAGAAALHTRPGAKHPASDATTTHTAAHTTGTTPKPTAAAASSSSSSAKTGAKAAAATAAATSVAAAAAASSAAPAKKAAESASHALAKPSSTTTTTTTVHNATPQSLSATLQALIPAYLLQLPGRLRTSAQKTWKTWASRETAQKAGRALVQAAKRWYHAHQRACMLTGAAMSGLVALKSSLLVMRLARQARVNAFFRGLEHDMVHLFVHPRWTHGPNPFPGCVHVEAFLRLARIPYVVHFTNDSSLSPNGRLPFIVHNGTKLAEGELIVEYLTAQYHITMNQYLTKEGHAKGACARRLVETSLAFGLTRATFVDHPDYMTDMFAKEYALQPFVAGIIVRSMRNAAIRQLNHNTYGNLSQELYETEFQRDVVALEAMLRDNGHYIGGRLPSSYDCTIFAWLQVAAEFGNCGNATLAYLANSKIIRDYIQHMTRQTFPDMDKLETVETVQRFIPISTPRTPRTPRQSSQSQSQSHSQPRQESPSYHK